MNIPSFVEHISSRLFPKDKDMMKITAQFYLEDLSTKNPWPAGETEQLMIGEFPNQVNTQM